MIKAINANSRRINAGNRADKPIINQEDNKISKNKKPKKIEKNIVTVNRNIAFLTGIFLILAASVFAQQTLPTLISLQGKLTNTTTGATIVNADLRVNISDTAGITVWNETFASGVSNGFFDLLLGSNADNPLNLTFNNDYNISIYVGSASGAQIGGTYRFRSGIGGINPSNITSGNFSASGNFSFGSSLFIDKTNNRVGIGTASPNGTLEVSSEAEPSLVISPGTSTTANPQLYLKDTGATAGFNLTYTNADGDTYFNNKWDNDGGDIFFRLKTDGIPINIVTLKGTGNVGIGTITPTKTLSVNGTLNALTIDSSAKDPTINTTGQNITISSSSGSVIIQLG